MVRLGSPGCRGDGHLRRGGEEASRVASTSLPQPAAFERLRRPENEILMQGPVAPNDSCIAIRVDGKASRGARRPPQPSPSPLTWCASSAQAVHAAGGPGRSTSRRQVPDVAAGGGARRRVSIDRLRFRDGARRGRRRELFEAAPPLVGAPAGRHPYGRRSSDGRALLVVLVFEGPSSVIYKRLSPFFAYLELHSSRNLDQTVVCGLRGKPVDSPKNRRAAARRAPLTKTVV